MLESRAMSFKPRRLFTSLRGAVAALHQSAKKKKKSGYYLHRGKGVFHTRLSIAALENLLSRRSQAGILVEPNLMVGPVVLGNTICVGKELQKHPTQRCVART